MGFFPSSRDRLNPIGSKRQYITKKKMKKSILYALVMTILFTSCAIFQGGDLKGRQGKIMQDGSFECFPIGTLNEDNEILNCETSAVVYYGDKIVAASDKATSPSSFFELAYTQDGGFDATKVTHIENDVLNSTRKIEDFSISPDGKLVVGTTAFDRFNTEKTKWNAYNSIVYWDATKDSKVKLAHSTKAKSSSGNIYPSSVTLRSSIEAAFKADNLEIPAYYKIEGLAIIPDNKILFGIRETGKTYEDFDYQIKIISADYIYAKSELEFTNFRIAYDFDASDVAGINQPIALSSIEYDKFNDRLYILTSYEHNKEGENKPEKIGAYLWVLPMQDFKEKNAPQLVMKSKKHPLLLAHKSEGVTVIDKNTVFIINDDDRVTGDKKISNKEIDFSREPNEATYYILRIK
jgi:hypothetical protein